MKNQYFGDNRDLFKFDLAENILKNRLVKNFFYVSMLTANDKIAPAADIDRKKAEAGFKNKKLVKFLDDCAGTGKPDVMLLNNYFPDVKIQSGDFTHTGRGKYFGETLKNVPSGALILIDPDTGLKPAKSRPGEKYILNSELKSIYEKMDTKSILMVCQKLPRTKQDDFLHDSCHEFLDDITGKDPICAFDNKSVFFLTTKSLTLEEKLIELLGEYSESYS
jgi:hypothetical protein